jgi:hypothetical protein
MHPKEGCQAAATHTRARTRTNTHTPQKQNLKKLLRWYQMFYKIYPPTKINSWLIHLNFEKQDKLDELTQTKKIWPHALIFTCI